MNQLPDSNVESAPVFAAEYGTEYTGIEHARSGFRKVMTKGQQYQEEKVPESGESDSSGPPRITYRKVQA